MAWKESNDLGVWHMHIYRISEVFVPGEMAILTYVIRNNWLLY